DPGARPALARGRGGRGQPRHGPHALPRLRAAGLRRRGRVRSRPGPDRPTARRAGGARHRRAAPGGEGGGPPPGRGRHTGAGRGVIATPLRAAQEVADALVAAGVRGILNLAPRKLFVPPHVALRTVDMTVEFESLSFALANVVTRRSRRRPRS